MCMCAFKLGRSSELTCRVEEYSLLFSLRSALGYYITLVLDSVSSALRPCGVERVKMVGSGTLSSLSESYRITTIL